MLKPFAWAFSDMLLSNTDVFNLNGLAEHDCLNSAVKIKKMKYIVYLEGTFCVNHSKELNKAVIV